MVIDGQVPVHARRKLLGMIGCLISAVCHVCAERAASCLEAIPHVDICRCDRIPATTVHESP
jgi:hypothetical protein